MLTAFRTYDLGAAIRSQASRHGVEVDEAAVRAIAEHAMWVARENERLHLTSITDPDEYVSRHIGESFAGAAMIPDTISGALLDIGSGNGYPGFPIAVVRPRLDAFLAEASVRKAAFLRSVVLATGLDRTTVLELQVQRPNDLEGYGSFRVITSRGVGGWAKILPRLAPCLTADGEVLLWAGEEVDGVAKRVVWKRLKANGRSALPEREQSWIWSFRG